MWRTEVRGDGSEDVVLAGEGFLLASSRCAAWARFLEGLDALGWLAVRRRGPLEGWLGWRWGA